MAEVIEVEVNDKKAKAAAKKAKVAEKKAARKLKLAEKRAERKAKREAKRAALLAKKKERAEAKKQKREAKKAKLVAKREKAKAKKLALREKKRLAREKKRAAEAAKKLKLKKQKANKNAIDIRLAAKNMKLALAQIASEMAKLDLNTRIKKAKSVRGIGYDVETVDNNVIARFDTEKSKKTNCNVVAAPAATNTVKAEVKKVADQPIDFEADDEKKPEVEMIPAGDLYGQDGNASGEVANIGDDDDEVIDPENHEDADDEYYADSRDEQDDDLVDNRREFFNTFGDDGEMNGDMNDE